MRSRNEEFIPATLEEIQRQPTFEDELECAANYLRKRIEWMDASGVPFAGFIVSREFARALAGWLEQCARDRRREEA